MPSGYFFTAAPTFPSTPLRAGSATDRTVNRTAGAWSGVVTTTVDTLPPTSSVSSPATSDRLAFEVTWSGTDGASGIAAYDVQVQVDGGVWADWLAATTVTSATYTGVVDHTYAFRCRARDVAGNVEAWRAGADATTQVVRAVTKYYHHGGQRVALRRSTGSGSVVYSLHGDHPSLRSGQAWGALAWRRTTPRASRRSSASSPTAGCAGKRAPSQPTWVSRGSATTAPGWCICTRATITRRWGGS